MSVCECVCVCVCVCECVSTRGGGGGWGREGGGVRSPELQLSIAQGIITLDSATGRRETAGRIFIEEIRI